MNEHLCIAANEEEARKAAAIIQEAKGIVGQLVTVAPQKLNGQTYWYLKWQLLLSAQEPENYTFQS